MMVMKFLFRNCTGSFHQPTNYLNIRSLGGKVKTKRTVPREDVILNYDL